MAERVHHALGVVPEWRPVSAAALPAGGLDGFRCAEEEAIHRLELERRAAAAVPVDGGRSHGAHRHLADHHLVARLLGLRLGQPEGRHLRHAEGHARHERVVDRVGVHPRGVLHRDHALV